MKLTHYCDYSLRVLIYLGVHHEKMATIGEISGSYNISRNHVVKVVHHLAQLGYIETQRGKHGGIRLAHNPTDINVGGVIRQTEASLDIVECIADKKACVLSPVCVLKDALEQALIAFMAVMDGYTLQDLIASPNDIRSHLIPLTQLSSAT